MKRTSDPFAMTERSFWQQFKHLPPLIARLTQTSVRKVRMLVREMLPHCRTIQHFKTLLAFIGRRPELRHLCKVVKNAWEQSMWREMVRLELTKMGPVTRWWFREHRAEYEQLLFRSPHNGPLSVYVRGLLQRFA